MIDPYVCIGTPYRPRLLIIVVYGIFLNEISVPWTKAFGNATLAEGTRLVPNFVIDGGEIAREEGDSR